MVGFDPPTRTFLLTTPTTAYALRLVDGPGGVLPRHIYWGPRLGLADAAALPTWPDAKDDVLGVELPTESGQQFGPSGLQVRFDPTTSAVEWRAGEHTIEAGHLRITLTDRHYPLAVTLHYRVHPDTDVIERWTELHHTGAGATPITVDRADSAHWTLPVRPDYRLSQVGGEWSAEFQLHRDPLPIGETTVAGRRGTTRHQNNPWLMVDDGHATETTGEVWSTVLAWSGTFRLTAWRTLGGQVSIGGGAGHDGVSIRLEPGERWHTPTLAGLYTPEGFGATSRAWHAYALAHVVPHPDELRPVLYNSWEGTWFDVDEANQRELATIAAELGVEMYVVDDGWFGRRLSDNAALGDWWPNPDRFPNGLTPLIDHVHQLGMRFGLWVEPEMVNPDSDLYRAHPDWVLHQPHRHRTELRQQLVLNFADPRVAQWAHGWLDRLLADHEIDFLKWDMNRAFTEAGWPGADDPQRLWFDHTRALYALIDRLRADHPGVRIETCASGGGRYDLGILARTDQAWASDNTDPVDRIAIQHGCGQVYPALTMGAWASESPNPLTRREAPLRFRFHVAMAGALGISGALREWSAAERAEAAELVALYRQIRPVVQQGELYRLTPARVEGTTAVQYLSRDGAEAVVLAWRPIARFAQPDPPVRLAGLAAAGEYELVGTGERRRGAVLAHHGLPLGLPAGDHASVVHRLRRVG
ncbi:alpha-galactosidase [Natronosporangium hydrolyticum]|uniref:Alpha-galactosidase n=1 Tax=Natronosporangium hydrolyticum TaxID=2811111 RepID=A0A895YMR3_9ACTN|nr:alpha-galactosidase [Natronosporangium hydrolyticum]